MAKRTVICDDVVTGGLSQLDREKLGNRSSIVLLSNQTQ